MKKALGFVVIAAITTTIAVYLLQKEGSTTQTKEEAIKQAREYNPNGGCAQVLVDAVHTATGAKYTFNTSCLAPGWEPERQN